MTFGIVVFVILVVGAWLAVRELASAELRNVTSSPPTISFPKPPISVVPPTGVPTWNCTGTGAGTSAPQGMPSPPTYGVCGGS